MRETVKRAAKSVGVDIGGIRRAFRRRVRAIKYHRGAPADWYDDHYREAEEYGRHYSDSRYYPIWEQIAERIDDGARVLDIGCGTGQLAHLLTDERRVEYVGFDFSEVAVGIARRLLPGVEFLVDDARTTSLVHRPVDVVVCTEVLEHIREDLLVLERLPAGRRVIATVPDFEAETHLRWFQSEEEVSDRYGQVLSALTVSTCRSDKMAGRMFLIEGRR